MYAKPPYRTPCSWRKKKRVAKQTTNKQTPAGLDTRKKGIGEERAPITLGVVVVDDDDDDDDDDTSSW